MLTLEEIFKSSSQQLFSLFDPDEAKSIVYELIDHHFEIARSNYLSNRKRTFDAAELQQFNADILEVLNHKPLQYTIGKAWFLDRAYFVNEAVLIPRPETEELVVWAIDFASGKEVNHILEIGTGSGCIATSLALGIKKGSVTTIDVSEETIAVAEKNIERHQAKIKVLAGDFLLEDVQEKLANKYDIIISNPPYIPRSEEEGMSNHVKDWEPDIALFVPDNDPLLFYKSIAHFAKDNLAGDGAVFLECHYKYAVDTELYYQSLGFNTVLKKDISGNDRMLKAWK